MGLLLLLLLPPFVAGGAPAPGAARTPCSDPAAAEDPLRSLATWVARARHRRTLDEEDERALAELLREVRLYARENDLASDELGAALLGVAALDWVAPSARETGTPQGALARLGLEELDRRLRGPGGDALARWLAAVVAGADGVSVGERAAAADALVGRYVPESRAALFAAARDAEPELALTARRALVGWDQADVHALFLDALDDEPERFATAVRHFGTAGLALGPGVRGRLRTLFARLYLSEDWRDAARARTLVPLFETDDAVPILIESLEVWDRRTRAGSGSRRIRQEIALELQRLSGRSLGSEPGRWRRWWEAVQSGRIALPGEQGGTEIVSRASFFGLDLETDKVLFVVDRSGSMRTAFGTSGRSRYDEAIDQLFRFLEAAGPETRFNVVLFAERGYRWRTRLASADAGSLREARQWLESRSPKGGTELREGLRTGLELGRSDELTPARVEADTVVVLCDGETSEGPAWVAPWLARENAAAQLVFHCVRIGASGNGTLEALAEGTHGELVRAGD